MTTRKFKESPMKQGQDEEIAYILNTTPWGGYDSDAAAIIKDASGTDVSSTNMSGSVSASDPNITTPLVISLAPNVKYRLEIKWVKSGNTFEAYGEIIGTE